MGGLGTGWKACRLSSRTASQHVSLSFEVISKGNLIFCKDHNKLTEFNKNVFLYYLDTKPLRDMIDATFRKRWKSGHFGERNYA
jgi:hypothetical protein